MVKRLRAMHGMQVDQVTHNLSQTYDFAEHHKPDCIILSLDLADCAEFELLASLLRILGICCIIVGGSPARARALRSLWEKQDIVFVSEEALDEGTIAGARSQKTALRNRDFSTGLQKPVLAEYDRQKLLLIGASTGGVDALLNVLKCFPKDCPPTLVVQHTGGRFAQSLIRLLDNGTAATVRGAVDGAYVQQGHVYLAPDDGAHLQLHASKKPRIALSPADPVCGHRPSVDTLFESALHLAPKVTAALLTGMGRDGAKGITALRKAGAYTIAQDAQTCIVHGMPRVAVQLGGIDEILPINQIGSALLRSVEQKARA